NVRSGGPETYPSPLVSGRLRDYVIPESSTKTRDRTDLEFVFRLEPPSGVPLFAARVARPNASDWYRSVEPYKFELRNITSQRGGVTITNNVINPELGDVANLNYVLDSGGVITINVFNLAGDLIQNLQRGRQEAGEYSVTWDGRNRGGRIVSRGIYFIRVVGPDLDEYRKVMVVK
ncbi:MAG: T9SS C-terminal target domain-containing protein, partial [Spirochaetaceae bacterium]